jgi:hypothetical protein
MPINANIINNFHGPREVGCAGAGGGELRGGGD